MVVRQLYLPRAKQNKEIEANDSSVPRLKAFTQEKRYLEIPGKVGGNDGSNSKIRLPLQL